MRPDERGISPTWWNNTTVREVERSSIRAFVESCSEHLTGRVLDYGCGKQPYRDIVEAAGGEYYGFDMAHFPGNVSGADVLLPMGDGSSVSPMIYVGEYGPFDSVICNQIVQYVPLYQLVDLLTSFRYYLAKHGLTRRGGLVLTYPTTWAEVEPVDLTRFTKAGMERLLAQAGFEIERHEERAAIDLGGFRLPLGYGVLAYA